MAEEIEIRVSDPEVLKRLDKINWEGLEKDFGVKRSQIERNPKLAADLVYGRMTDLVNIKSGILTGVASLKAFPVSDENKLWDVRAFTKRPELKPGDDLLFKGEVIFSKTAKENLFEMGTWDGTDGKKKYGHTQASSGIPVAVAPKKRDDEGNIIYKKDDAGEFVLDKKGNKIPEREEKKSYIISIHWPTNTVHGIPVDSLKKMLLDDQGKSRGISMYGVKLTDEQVNAICEGKAVYLKGCQGKDGKTFDHAVQFDVCKNGLVPVNPLALKKAMQMGAIIQNNVEPVVAPAESLKKSATAGKKVTKEQKEASKETKKPGKRMPR